MCALSLVRGVRTACVCIFLLLDDPTRSWLKRLETPDVRVQELDVIRAQRLKLQSQMETFKADSAEQLRQQEEQTLAMLEKVVERMQTERGRLLTDQRLMQVRSTS